MNERLKQLRKVLGYTQEEFSKKIGIKRNTLANYEIGRNAPIDAVLFSICREFDVSEEWLKDGQGEMFVESDTFSLDEFVKRQGASDIELDIIKCYFELELETRQGIVSHFKKRLLNKDSEIAATKENSIDKEVESYRLELEAEKKGRTSSVLDDTEETAN